MSIRIRCPGCQRQLTVKEGLAGKRVKCPSCERVLVLPVACPASQPETTSPLPRQSLPANGAKPQTAPPTAPRSGWLRWPWYAAGAAIALSIIAVMVFAFTLPKREDSPPETTPSRTDATSTPTTQQRNLNEGVRVAEIEQILRELGYDFPQFGVMETRTAATGKTTRKFSRQCKNIKASATITYTLNPDDVSRFSFRSGDYGGDDPSSREAFVAFATKISPALGAACKEAGIEFEKTQKAVEKLAGKLRVKADKKCLEITSIGVSEIPPGPGRRESGQGDLPTAEEKKGTVDYLHSLQRDSGGFAELKKAEASVPATFAAAYALRYFGGQVKDKKACEKFVESCRKLGVKYADTPEGDVRGWYSPTPGGKADLRTTALAAMIRVELPPGILEPQSSAVTALRLLDDAKTLEDYRLLGEFLLTAKRRVRFGGLGQKPAELVTHIKKSANPDGSFGKGDTAIRDSAAAVGAIRGLGGKLDKAEAVAKLLSDGQRPDGGWGKDKSDLETTWRVVHALALLKGKCDVTACRKFVAKCRNGDGSYGPQPGQPGSVHATYHAGAVLHGLSELAERKK